MASTAASPALAPSSLLPLSAERVELLERLLHGLDSHSLYWISGYVAAAAQAQLRDGASSAPAAAAASASAEFALTIVYGSQTGNAAKIATALHQQLQAQQVPARLIRADRYSLKELRNEKQLYVVISTQGDGDPPEDSRALVEQLLSARAPKLEQLSFAVLALGDSSYPKFCSVGKAIDARLADLGAQRLFERADADVEIEVVSEPWLAQAKASALKLATARPSASVLSLPRRASVAPAAFHAEHPYSAQLLANQRITTAQSSRDIRHLELGFDSGSLRYEPGDALGVIIENPPGTVSQLLQTLNQRGDEAVALKSTTSNLAAVLAQAKEITRVSKPFIAALQQRVGASARTELEQLLSAEGSAELSARLNSWQLLDFLQRYPSNWQPQELVDALRPLKPRLYSIASSMRHVGDEVHLCVAHIAYQQGEQARFGAGSHYLARAETDRSLRVFVESNERFRLPSDPSRDVIMIGPGTGVAPFRAFVQERAEIGASGRHWLFFGNPNFRHDFLYQIEWQQALKDQRLNRLDLAFSRDQAQKIYVQQRLREQAEELYRWLENGAYLYVCGDATRMAKDVEQALLEVIGTQSGKSSEQAREYLTELNQSQRYQRDIY